MQRQRKEQPLRRRLAALEHAHELLVQHALVRRVLVDEHDAVVVLEHHVRASQLEQRRHDCVGVGSASARGARLRRTPDSRPLAAPLHRRRRSATVLLRVARSNRPSGDGAVAAAARRRPRAVRPAGAVGDQRRTPSAALASKVPSARRTASSTARSTTQRSRKRTSAFAGCTLTSTASAGTHDVEQQRRTQPGGERRAVRRLGGAQQPGVADRRGRSR